MVCQYAAPYPIPGLQHYNLHIGGEGVFKKKKKKKSLGWSWRKERSGQKSDEAFAALLGFQ